MAEFCSKVAEFCSKVAEFLRKSFIVNAFFFLIVISNKKMREIVHYRGHFAIIILGVERETHA